MPSEALAPEVAGEQPAVGAAGASAVGEDEEPQHHAIVLCVANQKGGVGKTTTTVSLAAALALEGAQVLVVDLDPQGNATTGLGLRGREGAPSTYRVLIDQMPVEDATEPTAVRGLHVVPSSLDLAGAEIELVSVFSREQRLRQAIDQVRDLYDVVLIDCPPSLGLLTINALVATDLVVVPIQCEYYALEGLGQLMRTLELVKSNLNNQLELGGVVLTMFDARTRLAQQVADEVREHFGETVFDTVIPRTVRLSEAPGFGQPINVFDPSSRGARAYQRLGAEVAARLGLDLQTDVAPEEGLSALDRLLGSVAATGEEVDLADELEDETSPDPPMPAELPTDLRPADREAFLTERGEPTTTRDEEGGAGPGTPAAAEVARGDVRADDGSPPPARPDRLRDAATAALSSYVSERPAPPSEEPTRPEAASAHASQDPTPASTSSSADAHTPVPGPPAGDTGAAPWTRPPSEPDQQDGQAAPRATHDPAGTSPAEAADGGRSASTTSHGTDESHEAPDTASDDDHDEEEPSSWWR